MHCEYIHTDTMGVHSILKRGELWNSQLKLIYMGDQMIVYAKQ